MRPRVHCVPAAAWRVCAVVLATAVLAPTAPAKLAAQDGARLTPASFSAEGLNFETELTALYLGDFANARLERTGLEFSALLRRYLDVFARRCDAHLPANNVEMTRQECATERVVRDGWGNVVNRSCVSWVEVGTGLYADPALYAAAQRISAEGSIDILGEWLGGFAGDNPMATGMRVRDVAAAVQGEMESLLRTNECDSPGLTRFQDNMLRFALEREPLRLPGGETLASLRPGTAPGASYTASDYTRLLDDLVAANAETWFANRYVPGSASGVRVTSRDALGRPATIEGRYQFHEGYRGQRREGSVRIRFTDGLPQCMYFHDFPSTCRSPSRGIVTAYEAGRYR
jgi:hypothetical protein